MKIYLVSLGCPKNWVDSELMAGLLAQQGCELTGEAQQAELVLVNTCAFLQSAVEESIETILELGRLKETGRCRKLIVAGCLVQRYGAELLEALPEVDHFLGTNEIPRIAALAGGDQGDRLFASPGSYLHSAMDPRQPIGRGGSAYLKVSEGCSRRCSFCLIPSLRGPQVSRDLEDLEKEARALAERGVRELVLIAQDLTAYGLDRGDRRGLERLIERLDRIEGIEWIRLMYCYPHRFEAHLVEIIERSHKVVRYLDIPLQHTSDRILRSMRRDVTQRDQQRLLERLRRIEGMVLRTTLIVGYPQESQAEFAQLCDWVREVRFDHLGVFAFSPEEGTEAAGLPGQILQAVREERRESLMELQQEISLAKNRALIGQRLDVLVEGVSEQHEYVLEGRYYGQAPEVDGVVYLSFDDDGQGELPRSGQFVQVVVEQCDPYDLVGRVVAMGDSPPTGLDT
ncbi:MAG: 30S ribosomal protein S12 methylthiotransferase RimO [Bradymonadales bacterium]|nr:30S ribosomal protein S12 methylthiotransferase RimO [Bradymonadales bacterium]